MIPIPECIDGMLYDVVARNFRLGVFRAKSASFIGVRHKWGQVYLDDENHWDAAQYPTARPLKALEPCPLRPLTTDNAELFAWLQEKNVQYPDHGIPWRHDA